MKLVFDRYLSAGQPVYHPTRAFLALLPSEKGFQGVCREFNIQHGHESHIRNLKYDSEFALISDEFLCAGEDPRLFVWEDEFYCLTWVLDHEDWKMFLVRLKDRRKTELHLDAFHGKNWTPFVFEHQLFILHSFSPLCILRVEGDRCHPVVGNPTNKIGQWRGGTNAYLNEGHIVGFGHRTLSGDRHKPFYYSLKLDGGESPNEYQYEVDSDVPNYPHQINLIDPTSYWDGFVCATAAESAWHNYQTLYHVLLRVI